MKLKTILNTTCSAVIGTILISGCNSQDDAVVKEAPPAPKANVQVPSEKFDLSLWKMTVPTDINNDGKVDEISVKEMQTYQHPNYFYLDSDGNMVFTTPNKAFTTPNSSNTRSELHQVLSGMSEVSSDELALVNNFAIKSHANAESYGQIGGNLQATLKVNHVAKRATHTEKYPAYSVVVGQIHAVKDPATVAKNEGFGYGNEPLKIYFKKWPDHQYGSVFWNYERNLPKKDPNRVDISYPVWGELWDESKAPGEKGIALDESFSYEVNVYEDTMYLTFTTERHEPVTYEINLADNVDANGEVDEFDHAQGYIGDANFFKAGAYNQCSIKDDPGFWYAACLGTGDWETDKKNGDYAQVTFSRLVTGPAIKPE